MRSIPQDDGRDGAAGPRSRARMLALAAGAACALTLMAGCGQAPRGATRAASSPSAGSATASSSSGSRVAEDSVAEDASAAEDRAARLAELSQELGIVEDFHDEFDHGPKGAEYQKYIVVHDTEGDSSPEGVVSYWDASGNGVAAHFVIDKYGGVVQCVPLDRIAHHAGFGDAGHDEAFGVTDESRGDKVGTTPIGKGYPDYGMNSYSVGIELVHVGASKEDYPEAQLEALDGLIAYIDAYFGNESQIIDHKAWRTTNSDTSAEFAGYLASYQAKRVHA